MDIKNRELLELLKHHAGLDLSYLALILQTTEEDVHQRIAALEERRAIVGYSAVIDWEQIDDPRVSALIEVKVNPEPEVGFDRIAQVIAAYSEVVDVILVSGDYDLLVAVEGTDMRQIAGFVAQKLASLDVVQSTATHFVLRDYKKNGFIYGSEEFDHRLVIQL